MPRFVLLGHVGCGTTHLQKVLCRSPRVAMPPKQAPFSLLDLEPGEIPAVITDPVQHLNKSLRELVRAGADTVGITLHYSDGADSLEDAAAISDSLRYGIDPDLALRQGQIIKAVRKTGGLPAVSSRFFALWRHLQEDRTLRVVHLRRNNRIRAFLDTLASMRTSKNQTCRIDTVYFHDFDREAKGHANYIRQQFDGHPYYEADYEDLTAGSDVARGLVKFLAVPELSWVPDPEPPPHPRDWLINYDEWVAAFRDTPWQQQMEAIAQE